MSIGELKYGVNAIRALVRETGKTPQEILETGLAAGNLELGVSIVWAGMLWQNKSLTIDEVGDLLDGEEGLYLDTVQEAGRNLLASLQRMFRLETIPAEEAEETGKN